MKRFILTVLLGLGCSPFSATAVDPVYQNFGIITNAPVVDAVVFYNAGTFGVNTRTATANISGNANITSFSYLPYSTSDTLFFTNAASGSMSCFPGFLLDTASSGSTHSASSVVNNGTMTGIDIEAIAELYTPPGQKSYLPIVSESQPVPSQVDILSTNIVNSGTMAVGNAGRLQMVGSNVSLANGDLVAGAINTGGFIPDSLDTTGDADFTDEAFYGTANFYVNPPGVYDLFWGVTNAGTLQLNLFSPPNITEGSGAAVTVTLQDGVNEIGLNLPLNINPEWTTNVYVFQPNPSNSYVNIVFVNTNFTDINGQTDANIMATVEFSGDNFTFGSSEAATDLNQTVGMVQFALTVPDVITGLVVTNAIYLLDDGADFSSQTLYNNAGSPNNYNRPNAFVVTTQTPDIWEPPPFGESNFLYTPDLIYNASIYSGMDVTIAASEYGVQIGRNPGVLDGAFEFVSSFDGFEFLEGSLIDVLLPDPTNEPARIEVTANQLDISNSRWRAEGMVTVNASNFVGSAAASDWGEINSQLAATNGSLVVSNFYPTNFQRLRGDIYAWSGSWISLATNNTITTVAPFFAQQTNTFHYHVLVVDQNLGGNFRSAIRSLGLTGSNSVNVYDSMYVIDSAYINTSNLTFNSNAVFTQSAASLLPANLPNLTTFFNNTNGALLVEDVLDLGFDQTKLPGPPEGRAYTVSNITNFGQITATAPLLQSQTFENDGSITADNNGSMIIEAANIGCGLALTNATNTLQADDNITLSAISMQFSNSQIFAGGTNQGLLLLQSTPTGQITDFVSGAPSTNSSVINFWQVTGGFSLPIKPSVGDLFGTEITTIATNFTAALHTWSGVDMGPVAAGFVDNMVIGHLKLSRQSTNALLHFTGAGVQNAMYVDYLELDPNSYSYSDYRDGLVIDPNLTIYFATANVSPLKLEQVYSNRLVWVPSFAGPNSTVAVPYFDSTNAPCLMNSNLAFSPDIAFFPPVPNADNQPYVLNDPTNRAIVTNCPTDLTLLRELSEGALLQEYNFKSSTGTNLNLSISALGRGSVSPTLKQGDVALGKTYTLTATPADGWVFSGWSASGLPVDVDTSSRVLKFTLSNDVVLLANFTAKTFTMVQGAYYGLFTNTSPAADNSGWFTFTLGQSGALSGKLLMEGVSYAFGSTLPSTGSAQVVARHGSQTLNVALNLDLTNGTGQVSGTVSNQAWKSSLLGNLVAGWTTKDPSPFAGKYTMVLSATNTNSAPIGDSYGTLTVSKQGALSVAGKLADGNSFSQSVPVSTGGLWPFYAYGVKGGDFVLGWIAFEANGAGGYTLRETNILWSKAPSSSALYYPAGFTNTFGLFASPYVVPGKDYPGLSLAAQDVTLTGAGLSQSLSSPVVYNGKQTYAGSNLTLNVNAAAGSFTGWFETPGDGASLKLSGVVLQNQEAAFGFFLGTSNASGVVRLQDQ